MFEVAILEFTPFDFAQDEPFKFKITIFKFPNFGVAAAGDQVSQEEGVITETLDSVAGDSAQQGARFFHREIAGFCVGGGFEAGNGMGRISRREGRIIRSQGGDLIDLGSIVEEGGERCQALVDRAG